ncbi:hypothetical protein [uncultured Oscillibacter sp.]|uniref:hypothetical protein n=1 Tax=uncultured Oscillibacter sp. TaxID=876091 RepID=UPI00262CE657|nr:hypothetical protein [uncultured Oscillibacter sp.]
MRILKSGDPCPFCGQPLRQTDPDALRLLAAVADIVGLPDPEKECVTLKDGTMEESRPVNGAAVQS